MREGKDPHGHTGQMNFLEQSNEQFPHQPPLSPVLSPHSGRQNSLDTPFATPGVFAGNQPIFPGPWAKSVITGWVRSFWLFIRTQKPGWGLHAGKRLHQASCRNKFLYTPPVKLHSHLLPKLELWLWSFFLRPGSWLFQLMTSLTSSWQWLPGA